MSDLQPVWRSALKGNFTFRVRKEATGGPSDSLTPVVPLSLPSGDTDHHAHHVRHQIRHPLRHSGCQIGKEKRTTVRTRKRRKEYPWAASPARQLFSYCTCRASKFQLNKSQVHTQYPILSTFGDSMCGRVTTRSSLATCGHIFPPFTCHSSSVEPFTLLASGIFVKRFQ